MSAETVDKTLQRGLVFTYACMLFSGLFAIAYTPPSMAETIGNLGANSWGWVMVLGASACLLGSMRQRGTEGDWLGEYAGLWPLIAACGVYAAVVMSTTGLLDLQNFSIAWPPLVVRPDAEPGRATGGLLLAGFTGLLVVRWFRVRDDSHRDRADIPPTARRD